MSSQPNVRAIICEFTNALAIPKATTTLENKLTSCVLDKGRYFVESRDYFGNIPLHEYLLKYRVASHVLITDAVCLSQAAYENFLYINYGRCNFKSYFRVVGDKYIRAFLQEFRKTNNLKKSELVFVTGDSWLSESCADICSVLTTSALYAKYFEDNKIGGYK